jgi:hypothetical protein
MRSLAKWRSTAREAAKQSRRLKVPQVSEPVTTSQLAQLAASADLALILHQEAKEPLAEVDLPAVGTVLIIIGPEGGISDEELSELSKAGAQAGVDQRRGAAHIDGRRCCPCRTQAAAGVVRCALIFLRRLPTCVLTPLSCTLSLPTGNSASRQSHCCPTILGARE